MLRGDIVTDDSGSNAVFTSASQLTCKSNGCHCKSTRPKNHGLTLKIQWYLLNEICTVTHSQAFCGTDRSRKFSWRLDGQKYRIRNVYLVIENKDYSYRYTWMTLKWLERSRTWIPCGRNKLMKNVDLDEPTSLLDHVYLGCTQRECKPNETIVEEY